MSNIEPQNTNKLDAADNEGWLDEADDTVYFSHSMEATAANMSGWSSAKPKKDAHTRCLSMEDSHGKQMQIKRVIVNHNKSKYK